MTAEGNIAARNGKSTGRTVLRILLGLVLLTPAGFCCIGALVLPTAKTIITSFQEASLLRAPDFVGLENYAHLFGDEAFISALGFTLLLAAVRVLVIAVMPPLLALAVNEFGRAVRIPVRLLFTVPLALFAPVATALAWTIALHPDFGLATAVLGVLGQVHQPWLGDPERARTTLLLVDGLTTFGLACGIGLVFYLAALRGPGDDAPSGGKAWAPLIACWVAGLLVTIALTLQSFTMSYALTRGGPLHATTTLGLLQHTEAFRNLRLGPGAATATLVLIVVGSLGLVMGLIIVFAGLRFETVGWGKRSGLLTRKDKPNRGKTAAIVLLVATLLVSLFICSLSALPRSLNLLNSLKTMREMARVPPSLFPASPSLDAYRELGDLMPVARVMGNTVLPALLALALQVPIVYLGALGIGAVRPFNKWSELLLLPFSPWLFVTIGPLSIAAFELLRGAGLLDTMVGLTIPMIFSVPFLFILTLFFKGQEPKWHAALATGRSPVSAFFGQVVLPSLPLVLLLACVSFLAGVQGLLWPLTVTRRPETWTASVALLSMLSLYAQSWPVLAAAVTVFGLPTFVFFFLAFGLFQALYLDRLALVTQPSKAKTSSPARSVDEEVKDE